MNSFFLKLTSNDYFKGFVMVLLTTALSPIQSLLESGTLPDLNTLGGYFVAGLTAGVAYLLKNFLTNSQGKILTPEPPTRV